MPLSDAKEKLSAYQRWEMTSFEDENNSEEIRVSGSDKKESGQLNIQAQKEGFAKGFEEGYQVGLKTGQQEGLQPLQQQLATLQKIGTHFTASIQQAEHTLAEEVLDLALDIAKAMLKSTLHIKPELMIPIIEQAIASLPSVQQPAQLFLHPKDAALLSEKIGAELTSAGWVVVPDAHLNSGDCRIETLTNQIDGALSSRWQQLTEALGQNNKWYDATEGDAN